MDKETVSLSAHTDPHEASLWRAIQRDKSAKAREDIFSLYVGFARKIARRHFLDRTSGSIEFPDLCQLAYSGLLEAIDGYDAGLGVSFARYAERRIAGNVLDGIRTMSEAREQISFRNRIQTERSKSLTSPRADTATAADALDRLVDAAIGLALGFMLEGTDIFVPDGSPDRRANAYDSFAWKQVTVRVADEVNQLPPREQLIIRQHYMEGVDFDQLGQVLQLSKGRISQLHRAALSQLKTRLRKSGQFNLHR